MRKTAKDDEPWRNKKAALGGFSIGYRESQRDLAKPDLVRTKRLELLHLAALEPKSSVSTNSTTSAYQAF
jgi:hypothetical protein